MIDNKLFNNDVIVHHTRTSNLFYITRFGEDLYFEENDSLKYHCEYDIFSHNEKSRDFIIKLRYRVFEPSEEIVKNELHIEVEGHFEIAAHVNKKEFEDVKHVLGLSISLNFLRTAVFNFTSLTSSGPHQIPLINIHDLYADYNKRRKESLASKK